MDIIPTVILALLIAVPFILLPGTSFFKHDGFLDKLLTLTSALTGFYTAALVAAATFSHPDLDKTIRSGPIALITRDVDGKRITDLLTRREFVCTIFGYLAFSALVISLAASFAIGLAELDRGLVSKWKLVGWMFAEPFFLYVRGAVIFVLSLLAAHMAVVTTLGLYYLMDRLYRRDREITTPKPDTEAAA